MNREIKFRGKRTDTGKWVYGYYYSECGNTYIIVNRQAESMTKRNIPFLVEEDTVGQYTGLKDRNRKEIYEGDILLLSDKNTYQELVVVEQGPYGWVFYNPKTVLRFKDGSYTYRAVENYRRLFGIGEVVGNIHDNPELLEGEGS